MDGTKFDKLAKMLADGSSRRGFLKRAAAVAAGAAVVTTPGRVLAGEKTYDYCDAYSDCGKWAHCEYPVAAESVKKPKGTCVCDDGYEYGDDGKCRPIYGCYTDDDCDTTKHFYCNLTYADTNYGYGTCECADGYEWSDDKGGYCWLVDSQCYAADDCYYSYYEEKYGYEYDPKYYYDGYYHDAYGAVIEPQPEFDCIYGACVEVIAPPPPPPPPPPTNCYKSCLKRKRAKAGRSSSKRAKGGKGRAAKFRKACKTYCAKRQTKRRK